MWGKKAEWKEGIDFYLLQWSNKRPQGALKHRTQTHIVSSFSLICPLLHLSFPIKSLQENKRTEDECVQPFFQQ